ncbi:MAG: alpha/beta fold hydrolase [Candidatus Hydrogenedens sp.]|nr:alpha/beta fold hydrolase [Candidatus Hydrogenedens sp.]
MHKTRVQIAVFAALAVLTTLFYLSLVLFVRVPGHYFDSNGARLYYTDEGQGEPVVLVHGFAADGHLNWRLPGVVDLLKQDYRVITLDARAHGKSAKPHEHGQYGMEMVDDIARLMDHLGIEKAHLAGYSMGGFLSLSVCGTLSRTASVADPGRFRLVSPEPISRSPADRPGLARWRHGPDAHCRLHGSSRCVVPAASHQADQPLSLLGERHPGHGALL